MLEYLIAIATYISIYIIIVLSFNLAVGFTGLVNLGHMVFFGIGAYTSAILTLSGVPWYFAIFAAAVMSSVLGVILAAITVRLKGDYFQIVTLGLVFIAIAVSRNWESLTRGALGLPGIPPIIKNDFYFMVFVVLISLACIFIFYKIVNSGTGKIFQAIRDDETAASILGKNTYFYKVLCIAISTFFVGFAGSLFVHYIKFVDPTIFDLDYFVIILSMLIAGGLASIGGSILGVIILSFVIESLRFVSGSLDSAQLIIISITLGFMLVLLFLITKGIHILKRAFIIASGILVFASSIFLLGAMPELTGAVRQILFILILMIILIFRPRGILGKVDV